MSHQASRLRCRWAGTRLPLLDGGELTGSDRRKVESHLVVCAECRARRVGLAGALGALRAAAAEPPPGAATVSAPLWPALRRQIRESRHERRRVTLPFSPRASARVAAAGLIAASLASAGVGAWVRTQIAAANERAAVAALPVAADPTNTRRHSALDFGPASTAAEADVTAAVPDRTPASRLGYDLDRGTPMLNPDAGQTKPSY